MKLRKAQYRESVCDTSYSVMERFVSDHPTLCQYFPSCAVDPVPGVLFRYGALCH